MWNRSDKRVVSEWTNQHNNIKDELFGLNFPVRMENHGTLVFLMCIFGGVQLLLYDDDHFRCILVVSGRK